ncbi:MAG: hypothetical protein U9O50_07770 [Acidobacteriota bacterium]|nr:hypothetical protein [Acidobacteriota bacterium]
MGKNINNKILKLLYRSFDSDLNEKEKRRLEEVLETSKGLRQEKEQILAQRKAISESAATSFKPFFAERVISRIDSIKEENGLVDFYESLKAIFRRFAIAGVVIMIVLIFYNFTTGEGMSVDDAFYTSDVIFEEILDMPLF